MKWSGLKNFFGAIFAIVVLAGFSHPVGAASTKAPKENVVHVRNDYGGDPDVYLARYKRMARNGTKVIVAEECSSACAILIGIILPENICVMGDASFGFHSVVEKDEHGRWVYLEKDTREMLRRYPKSVRDWIRRNGGLPNAELTDDLLYLKGQELLDVTGYRRCDT